MTKKESVLKAAKEVFGERGYAESSLKRIAERAGVALGLLSHHYGNKEKLFMAAGLDVMEQLLDRLERAVEWPEDGKGKVLAFARAYLEFSVDQDEDFPLLVACSPYSDIKGKEAREYMAKEFSRVLTLLENCVRKGVEDGSIEKQAISETAQVVSCNLVGAVRTRLLTPYSSPDLYDHVLKFIETGLSSTD